MEKRESLLQSITLLFYSFFRRPGDGRGCGQEFKEIRDDLPTHHIQTRTNQFFAQFVSPVGEGIISPKVGTHLKRRRLEEKILPNRGKQFLNLLLGLSGLKLIGETLQRIIAPFFNPLQEPIQTVTARDNQFRAGINGSRFRSKNQI
jgi:hypothetical protein